MYGRVIYVRESGQSPLMEIPRAGSPLDLVVLYNNPALTAHALTATSELARGFETAITLMAVHVLPYPAPLECQEGIRKRLETELTTVARSNPAAIRVKLVFARDRADACLGLLKPRSVVVIGARQRWWTTPEERLARRLAAHGHSVAVIKVK